MNNLPALRSDTIIARLETANAMLAEADTISKKKVIVDVAAAAEVYAHRQKLGEEAIAYAHSIKVEALRQIGVQLKATPRNNGKLRHNVAVQHEDRDELPTLEQLGVSKNTSAMAQKLASLPEKDFEAVRDGHESIGKAIAKVAKEKAAPKQRATAPASEVEKLKAQIVELEADVADLTEKNEALGDIAASINAFQSGEDFKAMQILRGELRDAKRAEDVAKRTCNEMRKQIGYWKKRAEKCEGKK